MISLILIFGINWILRIRAGYEKRTLKWPLLFYGFVLDMKKNTRISNRVTDNCPRYYSCDGISNQSFQP